MLRNSQIIEYISSDIEKLKNYYYKCNNSSKEQIREKWLFTELKKISIESNCIYLKKAYNFVKNEELYRVEDALEYISSIENKIKPKQKLYSSLFKAILYELLLKYVDASVEYKKALKISFEPDIIKLYEAFIRRTKKVKSDSIDEDIALAKEYNDDTKELEKSAKSLEAIAKYYVRSNQSLELAQEYFKQALDIYKKMMQIDSSYTKSYVLALIKAYETYKLSKDYLNKAENLIFHSSECKEAEFYLLNKIKILKERD